ncbi:MAG: Tol-Pal system beta propeller repeat protein TolB, partial [Gammaproteobacteria bacterium]|nr:Tol-Pal system beta propeller repeat protein TolB [Gammaproteobacteria bacterium]
MRYFSTLSATMLAAVMVLVAASPARAELQIEITQGVDTALPIAVVPFGWQGTGAAPPLDAAAIVAADLARSGRFAPLDRKDMLQKPTTGAEVKFDDWRRQGSEVLVIGRVLQPGPDQYEIQFQVFDVLRGEQLLGYRQPATAADFRRSAHRVADLIYEKLTGVRGVFSTRIAYVTVVRSPGQAAGQGRIRSSYRLVIADADGENPRVMVESPEPLMSPAWSPDGRQLAYVSFEARRSEIYVQDLRSGSRKRVSARPGVNGAPAWSPDGRKLAVSLSRQDGNLDIYTLDINTQVLTRLTSGSAIDTEPAWSLDGSQIYFTSDATGGPQVYRVGADGGGARRVTFEGSYNARPRVAPDGKQLAVVHNDRGNYRIATVDLARSTTQVLSDGRLDESPSYAPNGEMLIFATREGARGVLATVSANGRIKQRISALEGDV